MDSCLTCLAWPQAEHFMVLADSISRIRLTTPQSGQAKVNSIGGCDTFKREAAVGIRRTMQARPRSALGPKIYFPRSHHLSGTARLTPLAIARKSLPRGAR